MALGCAGCGAESLLLWVTHRAGAGGRTACGLAEGEAAPAGPEPDCLDCLAGEAGGWELALSDLTQPCRAGCVGPRPHLRLAGLLGGRPGVLLRCRGCGAAQALERVVHLKAEGWRRGACGRTGALARHPAQVTCLACLLALRDTACALPPDWRPEAALAEDYYAV